MPAVVVVGAAVVVVGAAVVVDTALKKAECVIIGGYVSGGVAKF